MGAPSFLRGPVIFLSETAAWGERGRLGRRARKDFLSNGPGRLDSSMGSRLREERGKSRRKSWRGVGYLQTGSPRRAFSLSGPGAQKVPRASYPAGRGHAKEVDEEPQAEPAHRPAHRDRGERERRTTRSSFISFPSAAPHASENKLANGEPFISFILGPDPIK